MQDILRGRVSRNADVHSILDKKPKNKDVNMIQELDEPDCDDQTLHINVNTIQGEHTQPTITERLFWMDLRG